MRVGCFRWAEQGWSGPGRAGAFFFFFVLYRAGVVGSGGWAGDAEMGPETGPSGQASLFLFFFLIPLPPKFNLNLNSNAILSLGQVLKTGDPIYGFGVV
jgi:hypothetical protein